MLQRVQDLAARVEGDPLAGAEVEVDELTFRLVVMRRRLGLVGDGPGLAASGDEDLLVARRALAESLAVVAEVLRRLDPE